MKIGFVGAGNMASALLNGMIDSKLISCSDVYISDLNADKLKYWSDKNVNVTNDNAVIEENSDIIILAVKPNVIANVLKQMNGYENKLYISIAAGVSIDFLENNFSTSVKIIRAMPNTPAMVKCGMTVISPNKNVAKEEEDIILKLFSGIGDAISMSEDELEIATALHGSSPAYVYMMINAMADAGVKYGLTKEKALHLAAKAVEGSAKMVLDTGIHPETLKDNVCSPGGTTIAAVTELERTGFRYSLQSAISACINRIKEMKK